MKRTKIVCTLGPASDTKTKIKQLAKAGMDVARLNFSHGDYPSHERLVENVRAVSKELSKPIAILQDLQGPKIRIGQLEKDIELSKGDGILLIPENEKTSIKKKIIPVGFLDLHEYVESGDRLFFDDGLVEVLVEKVAGTFIYARVQNRGVIKSHKGINLPDAKKTIDSLTKKDKKDLEFGISLGVDYVALSFVQTPDDVLYLRRLIQKYEDAKTETNTKIIVKIEKRQAVERFTEILHETDAVMIARGDLGIEMPLNEVPIIQKDIIERCLHEAKPVVVATQMLDSMTHNPRPTRAEVSDVANAVVDHTDAVMLSQESATGEYPVETVRTMRDIILDTEESPFDDLAIDELTQVHLPLDVAMSESAVSLLRHSEADAILVASTSDDAARVVSSYRPEVPILVATNTETGMRQLALSWGVVPLLIQETDIPAEIIKNAITQAKKEKLVKKGEKVVIVSGNPVGEAGEVNLIKIVTI